MNINNLFQKIFKVKVLAPALFIMLFASIVTTNLLTSYAAGGSTTMSLSPGSGTYTSGSNFTVTITENSGTTQINTVEADLTYNQNDLTLSSISTSGSAFGITAYTTPPSSANGSLSIQLGTTTALTGSQTVASVTFHAASVSTATVSFAGTSEVLSSSGNANTLGTTTGGSYSIISSTCPSGQVGTPPNCTTPPPTTTTTPTPPKTVTTTPTPAAAKSSSTPTTSITPTGSTSPVSVASGSQVQISSPATVAPGTSTITPSIGAISTDGSVTKVQYYLNNQLLATKTSPPFSYKLNTRDIRNSNYTLITKTTYADGIVSTSAQKLDVKNPLSLKQVLLTSRHYAVSSTLVLLLILLGVVVVVRRYIHIKFLSRRWQHAYNSSAAAPNVVVGNHAHHSISTPPKPASTPGDVIKPTSNDDQ